MLTLDAALPLVAAEATADDEELLASAVAAATENG